jgi:hypothetical protein
VYITSVPTFEYIQTPKKGMDLPVVLILALIAASALMLLHHAYHHRPDGPHPLHGTDQCFQLSDVGNFHSCSHEMWIIAMLLSAFIIALVYLLSGNY